MRRQNVADDPLRPRIPHFEEYYERLLYEADPLGGFRLKPNQRLPHVTINEHGFRGGRFTGREQILVLGDSVTFGVGAASDEERFARFLERELGCPVADASMRACRVSQHAAQLPRLLDMLPSLRVVVLWCGFVDLLFWVTTGGGVEGWFHFDVKYAARAGRPHRVARRLVRVARTLIGRPALQTRATRYGDLGDLVEHLVTRIAAMRNECHARHAELRVIIQPFVRTRPSTPDLAALVDVADETTKRKCGRSWYEIAPSFVAQLTSHLDRAGGLTPLDAQDFVSDEDFFDQVHLRESAHRRLAATPGVTSALRGR
jgi:hypothetical protein